MDADIYNNDFEEWEGDYHFIQDEDWVGLVKLRKQKADKYPNDLHNQWKYGEALIFNKEFEKALRILTKIYKKDTTHPDVIHSILDALYGLGKTENEYDWNEKPVVLKLNEETKNLCKNFLEKKRKPVSFLSLYEYLIIEFDYLAFQEKDLCQYLKDDGIFEFSDYKKEFWDIDIRLIKKNRID